MKFMLPTFRLLELRVGLDVVTGRACASTHQIHHKTERTAGQQDHVQHRFTSSVKESTGEPAFSVYTTLLLHNLPEKDPSKLNDCRAKGDDVERRKQKEHQGKHELDADLGGLLLSTLPALGS